MNNGSYLQMSSALTDVLLVDGDESVVHLVDVQELDASLADQVVERHLTALDALER